jgi:hypothetical protein
VVYGARHRAGQLGENGPPWREYVAAVLEKYDQEFAAREAAASAGDVAVAREIAAEREAAAAAVGEVPTAKELASVAAAGFGHLSLISRANVVLVCKFCD